MGTKEISASVYGKGCTFLTAFRVQPPKVRHQGWTDCKHDVSPAPSSICTKLKSGSLNTNTLLPPGILKYDILARNVTSYYARAVATLMKLFGYSCCAASVDTNSRSFRIVGSLWNSLPEIILSRGQQAVSMPSREFYPLPWPVLPRSELYIPE